jgi:phage FluMu protein Com
MTNKEKQDLLSLLSTLTDDEVKEAIEMSTEILQEREGAKKHKPLTEEQRVAYLESPDKCPYCKSNNISSGEDEPSGNYIFIDIKCQVCGEEWNETYTLMDVTAIGE